MFRVAVAFSVFTRVQPVATTRAEVIPRIIIQLAPEDFDEIQKGSFSQLYNLLFFLNYYASGSSHAISDGTTDTADTLALDGSQILSARNLSAVGVKPTQVKLTMPPPSRADTKDFSLCDKQHRSLIQSWCPVPSKLSKQAKRFVDTADQKHSLNSIATDFCTAQASQLLFKSYA